MIGQIKVLAVNGKNYPITDKLYALLSGDAEVEAEISKIIGDASVRVKKAGKKK